MKTCRFPIASASAGIVWSLALSGCASVGCIELDASRCAVLRDFHVFAAQDAVHFDHHCSDPENHDGAGRTAYVLFDAEVGDSGKLLVLSEVSVGWVFGPGGGQGIRAKFHRVRMAGVDAWAGDAFNLRLGLHQLDGGDTILGDASRGIVTFKAQPTPDHEYHAFSLSSNGAFDWERFREPDSEVAQDSEPLFGFVEGSHLGADKLARSNRSYRLLLVVHNINTGDEIAMQGPRLDSIGSLLDLEQPEWATLGLVETLNPAQEGGLWHWLGTAAKFGDCIYARRAAKQVFDTRFKRSGE